MPAGVIQVPPDSTGKKLDTSELTVGANTVERQVLVVGDPATAAALAAVLNAAPAGTEYALVVRNIPFGTQTVDSELPAAAALADATANPTVPAVGAFLMGRNVNDGNWYRLPALDTNTDAIAPNVQALITQGRLYGFDGTNWQRLRTDASRNLLVSLNTLISGEDTTNNRLMVDAKPVAADSVQETLQNAAAATGNGTAVSVKGYKDLTLHVTGTFVGTVAFEGTVDDANWFAVAMTPTTQAAPIAIATAPVAVKLPLDLALSQLRARVSAWTSGTITAISRKHPR